MQTEFNFTHPVENNFESQSNLEANREKFSKQCKKVLDLLNSGIRLTVHDAMLTYGISSLPRRILDLKQAGVVIQDTWIEIQVDEIHTSKVKQWFIEK